MCGRLTGEAADAVSALRGTKMTDSPPMLSSPTPQLRPDVSARRWTVLETFLAVLSALLGLGTAYLGYQTAQVSHAKDQAQASAQEKSTDLSSLQSKFDELRSQNQQLQMDNSRLRSQLGVSAAAPTSPTATPPSIRRQSGNSPLQINSGYGVDLDSLAVDWNVSQNDFIDIFRQGASIFDNSVGGADYAPVDGPASYETCRAAIKYQQKIDLRQVEDGAGFCIRTNKKRVAHMTIVSRSPLTLDVIVWDPPLG